jgi:hypothetical protein
MWNMGRFVMINLPNVFGMDCSSKVIMTFKKRS